MRDQIQEDERGIHVTGACGGGGEGSSITGALMGDPLQEYEWGIHYRNMSGGSITGK